MALDLDRGGRGFFRAQQAVVKVALDLVQLVALDRELVGPARDGAALAAQQGYEHEPEGRERHET